LGTPPRMGRRRAFKYTESPPPPPPPPTLHKEGTSPRGGRGEQCGEGVPASLRRLVTTHRTLTP